MKRQVESVHLVANERSGALQLVLGFQEGDTLTLGTPLAYAVAGALGSNVGNWFGQSIEFSIRPVEPDEQHPF